VGSIVPVIARVSSGAQEHASSRRFLF